MRLCFHIFKKKNLTLPVVGIIIIGIIMTMGIITIELTRTIIITTTDGA